MSNTINIGGIEVSKFYLGGSSDVKIYLGTTKLYPHLQEPCFAVVDDITQYSETEFEDVYDKATEKWFKLNNLNQYEEYGIYGSGRSVTTYQGKLTIDDGYEYEWNGSSWVNLGEVSGSSRVPIGYTEVEYIRQNSNYNAYINTGVYLFDNTTNSYTVTTKLTSEFHSNLGCATIISCEALSSPYNGLGYRYKCSSTVDQLEFFGGNANYSSSVVDNGDGTRTVTFQSTGNTSYTTNVPLSFLCSFNNSSYTSAYRFADATIYSSTIVKNGITVRDFVSAKRNSDSVYGLYDLINDVFYTSPNGNNFIGGEPITPTEYPKYYSEKSEPLDNLTFSTLAEAQAYAEANCVYDGMHATIGADRYYFDSTDENGWVKILEYYKFEDVTPSGASGWTISGSSTYNPDPTYYDDFDLVTNWTSTTNKISKITIYGYDHFTYYLRSTGYSDSYAYLSASNIDELSTNPTSMAYNTISAITHTYGFRKAAGSAVNLSNYRRVTYNNLDKTVEHTFYVVFYGRSRSSNAANATILIPKDQTNENWEQVTFSASSNVASAQKNLYIDGNNSTSGGTNAFHYRWMIGLPSGNHTGYTNYSSYDYCPNVTSSTFTSVVGNSRQVNFTYDNTTNKSLSMRLVDSNGNVLSPSDTVYYTTLKKNSCNINTYEYNLTYPRTQAFKVGGSFYFQSSSNRHYIYGYTAPTLGTWYYVDNYSTTFDIVYTALTRESVSVTYTTYDPSDVETPAFKTDITWPYNGGTTSSTTLASYTVPYTYPYKVSQTSDKFSADSQSFTAGQASRTISFTLYPNNREFATVADLETYQYAWEGMKATVGDTKYQYKNGEWVEQAYTQYEYIRTQNAATIYYDFVTNFKPTNSHTLEVKVEFVDRPIDWGHLVSWYDGSSIHTFEFQTVTTSYQAIVRTGGNNGVSYRPTIGVNNPTVYTLPLSAQSGTYSTNGGSSQTIQYNYSTMTLPANKGMCFFGRGTTSRGKAAVAKMYYVKVYDGNGNLVKHYVPSDNNGTPCFYEIVDGEYIMDTYTGSNHGTLTLGPVI